MSDTAVFSQQSLTDLPAFLAGGGVCGCLIASRDWSATPLGPVDGWPQSLKTATAMLLRSPAPMAMLWGEDGIMLYNDAYSAFAGGRHPDLLGSKVREGWPEVADFNDNVMKVGLAGETLSYRDHEFTLYRHGRPEQVRMNLDYSPVLGEDGRPSGVLCVLAETTDRLRSDRRLIRERERLNVVLESINDCFYAVDRDWRLVVFNRASECYFGVARDNVLGQNLWTLFPQGIGTHFERHCRAAMEEGVSATMQSPSQLRPDRVVEIRIAPMGGVGISVVLSDITDRVIADRQLRESEARFRNMADHAPVMMWVTDAVGHCTYLNRAWYDFTGQTEGEAEGFGWLGATHPDDRARAGEAFRAATASQSAFRTEYRLRRADGSYRWAIDAAAPRFGADGAFLGFVGSVIDIDERREVEERIRDNEERLRLATEAAEVGFWDVDVLNDLLIWPASVKAMFGISADVPVSMADFYVGLHPDDQEATTAAFNAAADPVERALYDVEYRTIGREDGVIRWVAAKGRGVFDDAGRCTRVIGVAVDITARKRDELHQRLLIDELNHRVKNTLAIVQGIAQQTFKDERVPRELRTAFEGRLAALSAAHNVLTRENWEAASIHRIVEDAVAPYRGRDGAFLIDGPRIALAPKTAVSLALAVHELATNAVKYGALSVSEGKVDIRWWVSDGRLRLVWRERGGPPVTPPGRRGFGSRMIERGLTAELGGKVSIEFEPEGVVCTVDAPLPDVGQ